MVLTIVGCGYVGSAVARQLQSRRQDHPLVLTTTREERRLDLTALADRVQICDATNPEQLKAALTDSSAAVFCLGPKGNRQVDADGYRTTFLDSFNCLKAVMPALPGLGQIVYTSSCSVYGHAADDWVDETTPASPRPGHGDVLLESEQRVMSLSSERTQVCVLRLGALHGPGREITTRLRSLAGQDQPGDGQSFSNWVHVDDAAGAVVAAIDGRWAGVVNVVNDEPIRLRDLVGRSLQRQGLAPVRWLGQDEPGSGGRRIRNNRLKQLGYQLQHPRLDQSGVLASSQVP